jgi:hypothetical protein
MLNSLINALGAAIRGDLWLINGPISGLIPILLLYGCFEFGLDFFASRSRRERRMDAAMLVNCPLGIVVWIMKPHIPLILLLLLGLSIIVTAVTFILAIRGKKGRRKKGRRAARREATDADRPDQEAEPVPQEEAELAQS